MNTITSTLCKACRVCGSTSLRTLLSLGEQYVSDFVPQDKIHSGVKCPITLMMCESCYLVQQQYTAPQHFMYTRHYWYKSGVTNTMKIALQDVVRAGLDRIRLRPGDVVLDIGANDGTLLSYYPANLCRVGCEPAINLADECKRYCSTFLGEFWSAQSYFSGVGNKVSDKAKIVTAIGMFYDLEDPNQFIADIAKVLAHDGVFIAQLMCARNMLQISDLGNLCHEHLEFYSLVSLKHLLRRHGLEIFDMEINGVNGQSYRLYIGHKNTTHLFSIPARNRCEFYGHQEDVEGINNPITWIEFWRRMEDNKRKCIDRIVEAQRQGDEVWVYGASTKGNVILQYYGLDSKLITAAADRSVFKHGLYTIGSGIPIRSEEEGRKNAKLFLVLPYAFLKEFVHREQAWRDRGGRFLVPLPTFREV